MDVQWVSESKLKEMYPKTKNISDLSGVWTVWSDGSRSIFMNKDHGWFYKNTQHRKMYVTELFIHEMTHDLIWILFRKWKHYNSVQRFWDAFSSDFFNRFRSVCGPKCRGCLFEFAQSMQT